MVNNRKEEIIKLLLTKNSAFSGEELCLALGVSSRTIRNDIKEINNLSKEKVLIESYTGKGYKIIVAEEIIKKYIEKDAIYDIGYRIEYILIRLLESEIGQENITHNKLIDELYISLSSLKADIRILKEKLEKIDVTIEKCSNKGIKLLGKERHIRSLINRYIFSKEAKLKEGFLEKFMNAYGVDINELERDVKFILDKNNVCLTDMSYWTLITHIMTSTIRVKQKKIIKLSEIETEEIIKRSEWSICKEIMGTLKLDQMPLAEKAYISRYIGAGKITLTASNDINELVIKILKNIRVGMGINFLNDDILKKFLGAHLKSCIKKAKYNITVENTMLTAIKNKYPIACSIGVIASEVIYNEYNIRLDENSIGFLVLHFEVALERKKEEEKLKKVLLICTTGLGTSLLLKVKLEKVFKEKLQVVDTIRQQELTEEKVKDVDFLVSTIPLKYNQKDVIYLKNLLDKEEEKEIERLLCNGQKAFGSLFNKKNYFKNINGKNREEVLENITDELILTGAIDKYIKKSIIDREKISSTDIGNLVAIPHTMENIDKSFISVSTLKKPISWGSDNVQLIVVIGISKEERDVFKIALEEFYKKIIDLEIVISLIKAEKFIEIEKILK